MHMIYRAPARLPSFSGMLDELGGSKPEVVADYLGVSLRTLQRWVSSDDAPHAAAMAIWWTTNAGISTHDVEIVNTRRLLFAQVRSLEGVNQMQHARIQRLESLGGFGTANAPYLQQAQAVAPAAPHMATFCR